MKQQLEYKVTYGIGHSAKEVVVWAFDVIDAVKIAEEIMVVEPRRGRITKVEQIPMGEEK